jgi:hypothetical protein
MLDGKKGGETLWTGYQDNNLGYLDFSHSQKHYCRAASAGSKVLTNDLRYGHIRIMMSIDIYLPARSWLEHNRTLTN